MARFEIADIGYATIGEAPTGADTFFELGMMYSVGRSVPIDFVTAHKWFNLAAMRGNADAIRLRREIADQMSESRDRAGSARRARLAQGELIEAFLANRLRPPGLRRSEASKGILLRIEGRQRSCEARQREAGPVFALRASAGIQHWPDEALAKAGGRFRAGTAASRSLTGLGATDTDSACRRRGRVAEGGGLLNRYTV